MNPVLLIFALVMLIPAAIALGTAIWEDRKYKRSAYYQITKLPYGRVAWDKGRHGEYLAYKKLKHYEKYGARFLFNVYIPKKDGQTTEIDMLMICPQGIFVFESKNYSGWIFGSANAQNWYQTLPAGRGRSNKEAFYNPIMQNRSHIKHLQAYLGTRLPVYSVIVFSDHCTLRSISYDPREAVVINRRYIEKAVYNICRQTSGNQLREAQMDEIYRRLYPLTQVDEQAKAQHIANIHNSMISGYSPRVQRCRPVSVAQSVERKTTHIEEQKQQIIPAEPQIVPTEPEIVPTEPEIVPTEPEIVPAEPQIVPAEPEIVPAEPEIVPAEPEIVPAEPQTSNCPWCGGRLILRTATRGTNTGNRFYGCSNYPKCKYIRNI